MEAATPAAPPAHSTGSSTIADLFGRAVERYGDHPMVRHKQGDGWVDVTYAEAGEIISEIARGLIDLGIEPGDRVALLAQTRPEWTYADFATTSTGAVVVPIYPTNSPDECQWVAGNSESRAIICEDAEQVAKIAKVRDSLPDLEHIIVIDGEGAPDDAILLDDLRERGRARDASEVAERAAAVSTEDPFTFIYTSGTTGPPKGCVLTHGNYRSVLSMVESEGVVGDEDVVYLYLPLAHSFALLIQLVAVDLGATIAYFGGDTKEIIPELMQVKPTYLPSVPRIFEKIYTLAQGKIQDGGPEAVEQSKKAVALCLKVREMQARGEDVPAEMLDHFERASAGFELVRNLFGGRLRQATTGAAPIAQEILEFFFAAGVPVLEGFGMTETATATTISTVEHHKWGSVGKPLPGCEVKIAEDGELLVKGPNIFRGYYKMEDKSFGAIEDGWLHTGDLGAIDDDGYVSIVGRKKDIIITAGGKNLTPANLENDLKQSRYISQAVMYGDRRPFPVALITLDPEEIVPWAEQQNIEDTSSAALAQDEKVRELIQGILDEVNEKYAQVERIKKFTILDHDLSQETGELTPTLKVKRNVVYEQYAGLFDALYEG
jgi:long-chain acyl-CoA synthetase